MAEVAGVVLGGIPIALKALEKYHKSVKDYSNYDITLSTLRDNIFLQQQQLRATMSLIGHDRPDFDEVQEYLKEKFPDQQREFLSIIQRMNKITKNLLEELKVDMDGKVWHS